jgi:hypothetical protein
METPEPRSRDAGAILVLALIFMLVGSVVVIPLAGFATTNLMVTHPFIQERQVQSAVDGATDLAIETVRYSATQGYPGGTCASVTPPPLNGQTIRVDCASNAIAPPATPTESRDVTFVACPTSDATPDCPGHDLLDATVAYSDFTPSGQVEVGYSASVLSWTVTGADS